MIRNFINQLTSHAAQAQAHPREPWLWHPEWATGEVKYSSFNGVVFPFVFGIGLLGTGATLAWFFRDALPESSTGVLVFIGAIPMAGLIAVIVGIVKLRRWRIFGESRLELITNPGRIGGELHVALKSGLQPTPSDRITVTLKCLHRAKRDHDSAGENVTTVWKTKQELPVDQFDPVGTRTSRADVHFKIPDDLPDSTAAPIHLGSNMPSGHHWIVEFNGRMHGPNYHARFTVPVYRLDQESLSQGR